MAKSHIYRNDVYITPVCMEVTFEQYQELKPQLEALGKRVSQGFTETIPTGQLICYWGANKNVFYYGNRWRNVSIVERHCIMIDNYNPELYLALAAMTQNRTPIVGEWLICTQSTQRPHYNTGEFVQIKSMEGLNPDREKGYFGPEFSREHFRRANVDELISKLGIFEKEEEFVLPAYWYLHRNDLDDEIKAWFIDQENGFNFFFGLERYGNATTLRGNRSFGGITTSNPNYNQYVRITPEQFKEYILDKKEEEKPSKKFPVEIDSKDAQILVQSANESTVRHALAMRWGYRIAVGSKIRVNIETYKLMRREADADYHSTLDSLFNVT